mgnify:CR=1 FL=1
MKSIREKRQQEFADIWLKEKHGILNLCPRFGKIFTTINILEKMPNGISILIAYPDVKIKDSWEADFEKRGYYNPNITYTTHLSLKKHVDLGYDLIIIDEIHLLSDAQLDAADELILGNPHVLGLTGTLSGATEREIEERLDLHVIAHYPIELAIQEGVIVDYEINVIKVPLDNTVMVKYKTKTRTEKQQFDSYAWVIDQLERQNRNTMFLRLARMRIIQNSLSKLNATKALLKKSGEKQIFDDFAEGKGNHLAVVKIGNTGVTYKPLNKVIINYFDSNGENLAQKINRCMAMEYNTPDKKAHIYIISSDEEVEAKWLKKALEFFDNSKIKYI